MDNFVSQISKLNDRAQILNRIMVYLSAFALTFMTVMIVVDVFLRFVFNAPLKASVDMTELIEPYVVFLPFAYTLAKGRHVRVTLITDRFSKIGGIFSEIIVYIIDVIFFALLCCYSWLEFWHSFMVREVMLAPIKLPWWVGKFSMPLGMFVIAIQCMLLLLLILSKIKATK
jgi:TRAP-type C4-dicarboxylate transport system permease small subunit